MAVVVHFSEANTVYREKYENKFEQLKNKYVPNLLILMEGRDLALVKCDMYFALALTFCLLEIESPDWLKPQGVLKEGLF